MKSAVKYSITLLLLIRILFLPAQSPVLKNFTIKNGLPSNETYSIYQDTRGFIWICTDAGLVKYDANTFLVFDSSDGLPDNTVFDVKEDREGRIWYRTFSGNVGYVKNDTVFTIPANKEILDFMGRGLICSFHIDSAGTLYIGRQSDELASFLKIVPPYKKENVTVITNDHGRENGFDIYLFDKDGFVYSERRTMHYTETLVNIYDKHGQLLLQDIIPVHFFSSLTRIFRRRDQLVIANDHFIRDYRLNEKRSADIHSEMNIINVYVSTSDRLLVAGRDEGLLTYVNDTLDLSAPRLLTGLSNSMIIEDRNNGAWFSTLKNGIFYTNNPNYRMYEMSASSNSSVLFLKQLGRNKLNVALEGGGCNLYTISRGTIRHLSDVGVDLPAPNALRSMLVLNERKVLLSFSGKSFVYDYKADEGKIVASLNIDHMSFQGASFCGSDILGYGYNDLVVLDSSTYEVKRRERVPFRLTSFAFDPGSGKAFFGTMKGLYRYHGQPRLEEKDRVSTFRIKDIHFLGSRLMIATKGFGMVVLDGTMLDTIDRSKGLLGNVCEKIYVDGNDCWVSSNLGLSKISYKGYRHYSIVNYPLRDFETPSLIQDFFVRNDSLCFASGAHIYIYPLADREGQATPFYIYGLEANNRNIPLQQANDLPYYQSNIRIRFAALYYNFSGRVHYRYKLLPNDRDWVYTHDNTLVFPNLSAGSYSIVLQAQKRNGNWITYGQRLSFTIQKPFWRKWWFIVLEILSGLAAVFCLSYLFYKRKSEQQQQNNLVRIRLLSLEIKAMKAQMNPHFMFNSLNSIQHFILSGDNDEAYLYLSQFSKLVRMLLDSNEKEYLLLETEIEILRRYLEIETLRLKDSFLYSIRVEPSVDVMKKIPHMMIQPFVENAIWHGLLPKKGDRRLLISFSQKSPGMIECTVEDNGVGILAGNKKQNVLHKRSMAIENIRERLQLFSKTSGTSYTMTILDKSTLDPADTGTIVKICLPILNDVSYS